MHGGHVAIVSNQIKDHKQDASQVFRIQNLFRDVFETPENQRILASVCSYLNLDDIQEFGLVSLLVRGRVYVGIQIICSIITILVQAVCI